VDDEEDLRELTRLTLELAGHRVTVASDGMEGLRIFFSEPPDVVLLDIRMPAMDGWTLLERIREVSDVPVIMLTAYGQEWQKVQGLRGGADDYMVKPVGKQELLARIDAVRRRSTSAQGTRDPYQDAVLSIDFRRHKVYVRSEEVHLSPIEFKLLAIFVQNRDMVLSADQLLDSCWGDRDSGPDSVRVYMNYLRKKLEDDPAKPRLLETVRGFGYRYRSQDA
jgi:DNA-binding response OmpR family regulator